MKRIIETLVALAFLASPAMADGDARWISNGVDTTRLQCIGYSNSTALPYTGTNGIIYNCNTGALDLGGPITGVTAAMIVSGDLGSAVKVDGTQIVSGILGSAVQASAAQIISGNLGSSVKASAAQIISGNMGSSVLMYGGQLTGGVSASLINTGTLGTGTIQISGGSTHIYRCAVGGTLGTGVLTVVPADCTTATEIGIMGK